MATPIAALERARGELRGRGERGWLLVVLPLLISVIGCGSSEPKDFQLARTLQPIQDGQLDPTHTSVMGMFTMQGQYGGMCTGTLIAPNLVLTARHCISPSASGVRFVVCGQSAFGEPFPATSIFFTNDNRMSEEGTWFRASAVRVPPQGNDTCGFDMALVILSSAGIPASLATPYVPRIDADPVAGEVYQAVGYGVTADPTRPHGGNRMSRGNLQVQCAPGQCAFGVEATEFMGETGVCSGDSGGPALDVDGKVIGVVSRGVEPCDSPVYGAVSRWKDWIIQVAREAAEMGGYPPPFWVTTGKSNPEPPTGPGGAGGSAGSAGSGTTEGSGGGAVVPPPGDVQGHPCSTSLPCPAGYQCFLPSGESNAYCAAVCNAAAACGEGTSCEPLGGGSLCLDQGATGAGDSGGCAVAQGGDRGPAKPVPWIAGLLFGALWAMRRRGHTVLNQRARVEPRGIEPLTSALRTRRSPS